MRKLTFLFAFILFALALSATEKDKKEKAEKADYDIVYVTGNVSDYYTGETLVGVEVQLEGTDAKTYTDLDGNFQFENIRSGEYNIIVNYISYEKTTIEKQKVELYSEPVKIKLEPVK
ncbi:MAG: carboxypeptidase-like regulatory domain-containing protein [Prolixibacteraceae bacterium]|nr:carboxypeptidase-like regulatory domain-containing protein [Prolixibacteraceae bacterium]MBN2775735.1 carboxypeptidase-like regulatory domain-containing protein [Prolixibacteraceae bacterium]